MKQNAGSDIVYKPWPLCLSIIFYELEESQDLGYVWFSEGIRKKRNGKEDGFLIFDRLIQNIKENQI